MVATLVMAAVVVLSLAGTAHYIVATLRGRTRPNRVTWFLWGFAPLVMLLAQLDEGVGHEAIYTLMVSICPLLVVLASFVNRHAVWKMSRLDLCCGLVALLALTLWLLTQQGMVGFVLALCADVMAGLPNLYKAYVHPRTEHSFVYICSGTAALLTIAVAQSHTLISIGLPVWIACNAITMVVLIHRRVAQPAPLNQA